MRSRWCYAERVQRKLAAKAESELKAEASDLFFVAGKPRSRKVFYRDTAGTVTGFGDRREGQDIVWRRV